VSAGTGLPTGQSPEVWSTNLFWLTAAKMAIGALINRKIQALKCRLTLMEGEFFHEERRCREHQARVVEASVTWN